MTPEEAIGGLRAALEQSPDNLVLREHLAATLLAAGLAADAEAEYRTVVDAGGGSTAMLGLARAFAAGGKIAEALVVAETLEEGPQAAPACVLAARLLLNRGELDEARERYRRGVALDPAEADDALGAMLGATSPAPVEAADDDLDLDLDDELLQAPQPSAPRERVTFADVGGMDDLKEAIRMKIVYPITKPELFTAYGRRAGGGLLLYGPPGCGKTYLARATAGEIEADFVAVGLEDILSMWFGESEQLLHDIFEQARRSAPCVLFFDEIDAIGGRRNDLRSSPGRGLVNQFLAELDGARAANDGVLVLGATNAPWQVDDALRRPGRFDAVVFVPPPDRDARAAILRVHLVGKPALEVDVDKVAALTEGFSGADLAAVVDRAVEERLRASMSAGVPLPLESGDLERAAKAQRATTAEWMQTARSYALHANQAGSYDDVLAYLSRRR